MRLAITAARLLTPLESFAPGVVVIEDGRIERVGAREAIDAGAGVAHRDFGDATLAPGLVDIHVHGGGGHDAMEATPAALAAIGRHLLRHGVTAYCPTTVTAPWPETLRALERLGALLAAAGPDAAGRAGGQAQPLGLHLEGPFLSPAQAGVHPPAELLAADPERFEALLAAAGGRVALLTLAPELEGAPATIARARACGVAASLGHSHAARAQVRAAIAAGARHFTHTFNAMRPLHHRDPGIVAEALLDDDCTADIIADGIHVDPAMVKLFFRLKTAARAVLISDATAGAGCGDGRYRLGGIEVEVRQGYCRRAGEPAGAGGTLAGSVLALDRALRNAIEFTGCPLATALRAASYNPARVIGVHHRKGALCAGGDADLIVLGPRGEVMAVMAGGCWAETA